MTTVILAPVILAISGQFMDNISSISLKSASILANIDFGFDLITRSQLAARTLRV
ncbi:MAG: hypothetical protein IPJ69_04955 [Deltaproteobacteria bacterium]|nr:MAG: hypothetical protein IPJ69_04955 [Deltaproteobacteria bacterium]